jgi:predicted ATPase/DNA-binding CsgD family transcriptional regulator
MPVAGNLPLEHTSFIGREAELTELASVQGGARFLTLVGPGGLGKTRLGLRLAARVRSRYPDGVWFVDLSTVGDPGMLVHVVTRTLGVREQPGERPMQTLARRLRDAQLLLVLDHCDHQPIASADLVQQLLGACPRIRMLAISREPLNTEGDTIWRVPPLSLPPSTASDRTEDTASDAVLLFTARAHARNRHFSVTASNRAEINAICRHLQGVPLALELVAGRLASTTDADATSRLRLALARQGKRRDNGQMRQQIVRSTLSWTHRELANGERVLFRRLGVFAGGWDAAGAQDVCADDKLPGSEIQRDLDRLVAASLLKVEPRDGGATVYRMLDTVRGYALAHLHAARESKALRLRLLAYMVSLAEREPPEALNAQHAAQLEAHLENVCASLSFAFAHREAEKGLRLATAACSLWYFRGYYAEGCAWLERGLALPGPANVTRARATAWLGQLLQIRGQYAAAENRITDSLKRHQALGDALGTGLSMDMLGQLLLMRGDLEGARTLCAEAARRLSALNPPGSIASQLQCAVIEIELGDLEGARSLIEQLDAQGLEAHPPLAAWLRFLKGRLAQARGDLAQAQTLLTDALRRSSTVDEQRAIVTTLVEIGYVQVETGAASQALSSLAKAAELAYRTGERIQLLRALEGLAYGLAVDRPATAVRLASAAVKFRSALGAKMWPSSRKRLDAWLPEALRSLRPRQYDAAWEAGQNLEAEEAIALANGVRTENARRSRANTLTAREREIVALLARALTTRQIADELAIKPATARTHVEHILAKLGMHTRAQVIVWASQADVSSAPNPL